MSVVLIYYFLINLETRIPLKFSWSIRWQTSLLYLFFLTHGGWGGGGGLEGRKIKWEAQRMPVLEHTDWLIKWPIDW